MILETDKEKVLEHLFQLTDADMIPDELPLRCETIDICNRRLLCPICCKLFYCKENRASHIEK